MVSRLYFRWMWFWCWACYRLYLALPSHYQRSGFYRGFSLWLLGYAGSYAHSTLADFHLCNFFYRTEAEQCAAWDRYLATLPPADGKAP